MRVKRWWAGGLGRIACVGVREECACLVWVVFVLLFGMMFVG